MAERVRAGAASLQLLWEATGLAEAGQMLWRGAAMPGELRRRYGGPLGVKLNPTRSTVIANFVSTIDGVVALDPHGGSGGGEISGFFEPDRFVMGLLRSLADAVLVGSGTVRAAPEHRWTPGAVDPACAPAFAAWRSALELPPNPTTVVVTGSGELDPGHPGLADHGVPVVIATTKRGAPRARASRFGEHVEVVELGEQSVAPRELLEHLASRRVELVLCEGGPHLLAQLAAEDLLDELFLTLAPQLVGRSPTSVRLSLLEGPALTPSGRWGRLLSVRKAGEHLFTRYSFAA